MPNNKRHFAKTLLRDMKGKSLLAAIVASILGLYLATLFVPGVYIDGKGSDFWKALIFAGLVLGLLHFFIKPVIDFITLPLRFITLGLIGILINIAIMEIMDILFPSLHIKGLLALFFTSLIVWACDAALTFFAEKAHWPKKKV